MSNLPALIHYSVLVAGAASLLYAGTVTTAALVAVLAPSATRRRAARDVLMILVGHRGGRR